MSYNMMSQELRAKSITELKDIVNLKRKEIKEFSQNAVRGGEKNLAKFKVLKKDLARTLTILNEKEIESLIEETKNE